MTQDEIIEMARQVGIRGPVIDFHKNELEAFAKLVAAAAASKERELCITDIQWHIPRSKRDDPEYLRAKSMIARIRARGEA